MYIYRKRRRRRRRRHACSPHMGNPFVAKKCNRFFGGRMGKHLGKKGGTAEGLNPRSPRGPSDPDVCANPWVFEHLFHTC